MTYLCLIGIYLMVDEKVALFSIVYHELMFLCYSYQVEI